MRPLETKDTMGYVSGFKWISQCELNEINLLQKYSGYEYGFIFLIRILTELFPSYRIVFFLISFCGVSLSCYALIKLSEKIFNKVELQGYIIAFYVASYGLLYNGISVRAGLAMGLCLFSVVLFLDKKYIKFALLLFCAFTIHRTSIFTLFIILAITVIPKLKKRTHYIIWLVLGIVLVFNLAEGIMLPVVSGVLELIEKLSISGYSSFLREYELAVGIRDYYYWALYGVFITLSSNDDYSQKYLNVIMLGTLVVACFYGIRAISRAYDYFFLFMVPIAFELIANNQRGNGLVLLKKSAYFAILAMNAILMLRLCFI